MQINWPPEHCNALRDCLAKGLSFAEAADAINGQFGAAYSRNATIGRAKRMGLKALDRPKPPPRVPQQTRPPRPCRSRDGATESKPDAPMFDTSPHCMLGASSGVVECRESGRGGASVP